MNTFNRVRVSTSLGLFCMAVPSWASVGPVLNCTSVFPEVPAGTSCREVLDYGLPSVVAGSQVNLYRYDMGWTDRPEFLKALEDIADGGTTAIKYLSKYGKLQPISFMFTNENTGHDGVTGWFDTPCHIALNFTLDPDPGKAKQTVAHEVFHCFESSNIHRMPDYTRKSSSAWWVEGAAEYFSSVVYPSVNFEFNFERGYSLTTPVTKQANPYSTSLFFEFMDTAGEMTPGQIISQLKTQPDHDDPVGEMTALAAWPKMADTFHHFMQAMSNNEVADAGGGLAPVPKFPVEAALALDVQSPGPSLGVTSFAYNGMALTLPKGAKVRLSMLESDYGTGTRISYRKRGETNWTEVKPEDPFMVETECKSSAEDIYEFLVTSADSVPSKSVMLTQKSTAKNCHCQAPKATLDPCVLGNWKQDNLGTAHLLHEFWATQPIGGGYAISDVTYTGSSEYKIAVGNTMSVEKDTLSETLSTWVQQETGKVNVMGAETDALFTETFLQDDETHLCIRFDLGDGTLVSTTGGKRAKPIPVQDVLDSKLHTFEYTCKGDQLTLWVLAGATKMPARFMLRVKP